MKVSINNIRDIKNLVRELTTILNRLDFNNFESFEVDVTIPAASSLEIRNKLKYIPTKRIIVRQDADAVISDSTNTWSKDFVYLENHSATNEVNLTVIFIR